MSSSTSSGDTFNEFQWNNNSFLSQTLPFDNRTVIRNQVIIPNSNSFHQELQQDVCDPYTNKSVGSSPFYPEGTMVNPNIPFVPQPGIQSSQSGTYPVGHLQPQSGVPGLIYSHPGFTVPVRDGFNGGSGTQSIHSI